ncbi:magnesium-translocating P-type ATPase [Stomatobaculum longum]|uniref:magnesium-translocating P-type ATPase n=1 Tax=Stomatobaculum longum TaxID=796942 RepID=UPI0028F0984E|nr:magnesium-translocating P-type ATPase [Stomatobaculum longum]
MKTEFWSLQPDEVLEGLSTTASGLSASEAEKRLAAEGKNRLSKGKGDSPLRIFLRQFESPVTLLLLFATAVSFLMQDTTDALIIFAIVLFSAVLSFFQEYRAGVAVEELLKVVGDKVTVERDGKEREISAEELVRGDVILLRVGDLVPADCYLLSASGLTANESALTGETFPAEKRAGALDAGTVLAKRSNCLYMGTGIKTGSGRAVVVHTAPESEFGKISASVQSKEKPTDFERGVQSFGTFLIRITVVMLAAIFLFNILMKKPLFDSFMFALALSVGLTPQLLPAIISINLAKGAKRMAEQKVIVRKLNAIENFGSMDVLCSDKTGTITRGEAALSGAVTAGEGLQDEISEDSALPEALAVERERLLLAAYLNAKLQEGYRNPLDDALTRRERPIDAYRKVAEIPYSFESRCLTVTVDTPENSLFHGDRVMITKGALEEILNRSVSALNAAGQEVPLDEMRNEIEAGYAHYAGLGYRAIGLATRILSVDEDAAAAKDCGLMFRGMLLFLDPLKDNVRETAAAIRQEGVSLKIITGDNALIASNIAAQLDMDAKQIMTGSEIAALSKDELKARVREAELFAEVDPGQKEAIILALKEVGAVVGYMGDGINDAPALHAADVGISVESASDIAKSAASIVLLEQDLGVLLAGIREGRKTFANTLKYIFMTTSANFGNMFSMAGISLILPFLPLLPKQILSTNVLTDMPEVQIADDVVDAEWISRPIRWDFRMIRRFMLLFGLISSTFDYLTFFVLLRVFRADAALFRSGWFVESVVSAALVVLIIRTSKPFFQSRVGKGLCFATVLSILAAIALPYTPLGALLGLVPLPASLLAALGLVVVCYMLTAEMAKRWFYRNGNGI